LNRIFHGVPA
jgi:endo-beta-N-acetylglucosaminidase D